MAKQSRKKHSQYVRQQRAAERDITLPAVADRKRRLACEADPSLWLRTYIPAKFYREFTSAQERIISETLRVIRHGGDKAIAATRGEGKTATVESLCGHYGICTGIVRYGVIVSATGRDATDIISNIKDEFEDNSRLSADYPEVCAPIHELRGAPQAAGTQTVDGKLTRIKWSGQSLRFPFVKLTWCPDCYAPKAEKLKRGVLRCPDCGRRYRPWKSKASGAAFTARGADGSLRGLRKREQRPDVVILDDIETEEVARSRYQQEVLEGKIERAIGGLAGPGKQMGRLFLCTIQERDCLAATYTDPQLKPSFKGERFRQVERWPDAKELWDQYIELRQDGMRIGDDPFGHRASDFYIEHRQQMDAGAAVNNPHRFDKDPDETGRPKEISAIQHVHNQAADKGWDFCFCELQNSPPDPPDMSGMPPKADLLRRVNNHEPWQVPVDVQTVVAFVDCGKDLLWWTVAGWAPRFGGHVLGYGTFPDQSRRYFHKAEASPTLAQWYQRAIGNKGTVDEVLYAALSALTEQLFTTPLHGREGAEYQIARLGIDAGWKSETVYRFAQQNPRGALVVPVMGFGIGAKNKPMLALSLKQGERRGEDFPWRFVRPTGKQSRLLEVDTNFTKEFVHDRLSVPMGSKSPLVLFGDKETDHTLYVDHLLAERRELVTIEAKGWRKLEYSQVPGRDNDFLDTLVGCAALGSFEGVRVDGQIGPQKPKRRTVDIGELQRQARRKR